MSSEVGGIIKRIYPDSKVISVRRFKKGGINQTYDIRLEDRSLVLRIYPKDLWKVKKENYLYGLLEKRIKVPVPKVIKTGRNFILMSKVEGKELPVKDKVLVRKAGELLAKIHSINFPDYGWIINKEIKPRYKVWADFIDYDLSLKFMKIPGKYSYLKERIKEILEDNKGLLNVKGKPSLLHKDYHSSHIITKEGEITGIIDLEWAISGHNEFDVAKSCSWMFDKKPELERTFLQGYLRYGSLSKIFAERKKLYSLIVLLSSLSFSYECRNLKWCVYNLRKLKRAVNEYN